MISHLSRGSERSSLCETYLRSQVRHRKDISNIVAQRARTCRCFSNWRSLAAFSSAYCCSSSFSLIHSRTSTVSSMTRRNQGRSHRQEDPPPLAIEKNLFSPMQKIYADSRAVQCGLSKRKINWRIVNRYMSKFCSRFRLWDNFPRPRRGANAGPREEPEKFKIKGKWLESSLSSLSRANDWHWSLTLSYCACNRPMSRTARRTGMTSVFCCTSDSKRTWCLFIVW